MNDNIKKDNEKKILEKLKKVNKNDINENYKIYQELISIYPDNQKYIEKIEFYKKEKEQYLKLLGEKPTRSSWDGSYIEIKNYLKNNMHDPSSLDFVGCTEPFEGTNIGWLVACQYRGKNAFGALILNENWFIINSGKVIDVQPISTYKLN